MNMVVMHQSPWNVGNFLTGWVTVKSLFTEAVHLLMSIIEALHMIWNEVLTVITPSNPAQGMILFLFLCWLIRVVRGLLMRWSPFPSSLSKFLKHPCYKKLILNLEKWDGLVNNWRGRGELKKEEIKFQLRLKLNIGLNMCKGDLQFK